MEKEKIQVECWNKPGVLEMIRSSEIYAVSFSTGLDAKFQSLDTLQLRDFRDAASGFKARLLLDQGRIPERIGWRQIRLCEYTKEELNKLIKGRE